MLYPDGNSRDMGKAVAQFRANVARSTKWGDDANYNVTGARLVLLLGFEATHCNFKI
jgi:hypothetical protein